MFKLNNVTPPPHLKNGDHISISQLKDIIAGKGKTEKFNGPKLRDNFRQDFAQYKDGILLIVIHELPPSQNRWKTWHHMTLAEETKRWNEIIIGLVRSTGAAFKRPIARFNFYWPSGRNYDTKNYSSWKPLLDGLTRAGAIPDDNYKILKEKEPGAEIDKKNPRTEIIVREGQ